MDLALSTAGPSAAACMTILETTTPLSVLPTYLRLQHSAKGNNYGNDASEDSDGREFPGPSHLIIKCSNTR